MTPPRCSRRVATGVLTGELVLVFLLAAGCSRPAATEPYPPGVVTGPDGRPLDPATLPPKNQQPRFAPGTNPMGKPAPPGKTVR